MEMGKYPSKAPSCSHNSISLTPINLSPKKARNLIVFPQKKKVKKKKKKDTDL